MVPGQGLRWTIGNGWRDKGSMDDGDKETAGVDR